MDINMNILIVMGSARTKNSNSESIGNNLIKILTQKNLNCSKLYLNKKLNEEDRLIEHINNSDVIIFTLPVYENSVPGNVIKFFETIYKNKDDLSLKTRKMFVITNSGFPEVEASKSAISTCRLFAKAMNFVWLGGISVSPGALIDGKDLEQTGKTYKKLMRTLNLISEAIYNDEKIPEEAFKLMSKSFMNSFIYRFAGRVIQGKVIKSIGKEKFFSKPLAN
jgi:multimeric flavodoxin WrbA